LLLLLLLFLCRDCQYPLLSSVMVVVGDEWEAANAMALR
jgi:hypothetical protein